MRILFTSTAGLGHLHPLLPLARAARAAGDEVLFAVPEGGADPLLAQGFAVHTTPAGDDDSPEHRAFWRGLAGQPDPNAYVFAGFFARLRSGAALPGVRAAIERFRPELIVSEIMEFAGALLAEAYAVPHVCVGITAMGMAEPSAGPLIATLNEMRAGLGLPEVHVAPWRHRSAFTTGVPAALEGGDPPAGAVLYRHEDAEGPARAAQPRTPGSRPKVYATLGSAAPKQDFTTNAYRAVLAGLARVEADVLFTIGSLDPAVLGEIPANVRVERYVPQEIAMDCDAVVLHGGCGTTTAALSRGLPTVTVPLFADQPYNAARLAQIGAGLTVAAPEAATALAPAAHRVLFDGRFARAARTVAADIAATPDADAALKLLKG
jgi:UDP:flavonoid glycosyltransferase YjiC (YdhE family)